MSTSNNNVTVIDGGFSTQLSKHVGPVDGDPLWSARFNYTNPDAIERTHLDFLEAGAEVILTNTYQASVEGFTEYLPLNREESIELIKSTVKLAHSARDKFVKSNESAKNPLIFASIGPYGAHLHDGSEYTGSYVESVSVEKIVEWHKVRIDACVEAGVDGLAVETIPCKIEAIAIVDYVIENYPNLKFWISFQCRDAESIANGDNFAETVNEICQRVSDKGNSNLVAIGMNCVNPTNVSPLLKSVTRKEVPFVVYPNSGESETYSVEGGWQGGSSCTAIEDAVEEWIGLGVKFIGGCCRTNADHISKIKQKVASHM